MMVKKNSTLLALVLLLLLSNPCLALNIGDKLIPFSAPTMKGKTIDLTGIIGRKPVMLVFWATWCPNCAREIPLIEQLQESPAAENLQVISINVGHNDSEARAEGFILRMKMTYPVIFDQKSQITMKYKVFSVPTIIIGNAGGTVVYKQHQVPDAQTLQKLLD